MCHGTFVHFSQDICPFFTGHLSGHSSLEIEIEYRVRDRERENHPPVPPLKGGLRRTKNQISSNGKSYSLTKQVSPIRFMEEYNWRGWSGTTILLSWYRGKDCPRHLYRQYLSMRHKWSSIFGNR